MDDSFGSTHAILLQQEEKLQQLEEEKRALVAETRQLGAACEALQAQLRGAQRRAAEAEARAEARAASDGKQLAAEAERHKKAAEEAERNRHRAVNERILLEQAERGRRDAESQLSAARQQASALAADNSNLRQQLAAAQRQVHKLESLAPFEELEQEQRQKEAVVAAELAQARAQARQLEARCAGLEEELAGTAAALAAAQQLADSRGMEREQQQRAGSLSLSDLCDLDGACSQFVAQDGAPGSPQRSCAQSGWPADAPGGLPSRRRALQQRQAAQESAGQQRRGQGQQKGQQWASPQPNERGVRFEGDEEALPAAERAQHLSLIEGLERQLQEQQRQLERLQQQQQQRRFLDAAPDTNSQPAEVAAEADRMRQAHVELDKLRRRNTQLQTALADSSLQYGRAAAAAQRQLQEAQEEAALLRCQRDEAAQQLAVLQAAAAALGDEDEDGGGVRSAGCAAEQLEETLEYAARCNAAVEQNAALLQEKKAWLDKLRAAEAETERCRSEAQALRLQHLQLLPGPGPGAAAARGGMAASGVASLQQQQQQGQLNEELLQRLLEAQAAEAALRSVLQEAREEQVAACKALSGELRRVHALERLRASDMAEVQRLQRRLHEVQHECRRLCKALAEAQQAAGRRHGSMPDIAWLAAGARD